MIRPKSPTRTPSPPLPLLITGVAGVAGYNALAYFHQRYPGQVFGVRPVRNWPLAGERIEPCDVEDLDSVKRLFDRRQFRCVLDCAGNCALKSCELDPAMARRINVEGIRNILRVAAGRVRLVHLSIDLVFAGRPGGGYVETDATDPVTVYGKTMVEAEQRIAAEDSSSAVLRISLPMGVSFNGHAGAIDWIGWRFKNDRPATLYYDEVRTPTYTDCLNRLCERVLAGDLAGLYHAGGPRRLSLYEIAQIVNRVGGYDPRRLMGCPRRDAGPIPPRAGDVTLDSSKLRTALGYEPFDPWPLDERWTPTDRDWHCRRPPDEPRSEQFLAQALYRNPRLAAG